MKSKLELAKVASPSEEEPALKVGTATSTVAGLLALINLLFPELLNERVLTLILVISAFVLPIITALFTRGKVWSPASVKEVLDEAVKEAGEASKGKPRLSTDFFSNERNDPVN